MNEARIDENEIDENEIAELAKVKEEAKTREECVKAYMELELVCELMEKDPEAASSEVYQTVYDVWKMKYPEIAEKHLPKLYQRFMELWVAWLGTYNKRPTI